MRALVDAGLAHSRVLGENAASLWSGSLGIAGKANILAIARGFDSSVEFKLWLMLRSASPALRRVRPVRALPFVLVTAFDGSQLSRLVAFSNFLQISIKSMSNPRF